VEGWKNAFFQSSILPPHPPCGPGRFACDLNVSPIRPHADTPTPHLCSCGFAVLRILERSGVIAQAVLTKIHRQRGGQDHLSESLFIADSVILRISGMR
jgi:hypothetical protein